MKIFDNKIILVLILSIIIIYYLFFYKTKQISKRKPSILNTQYLEQTPSNIIKTEKFVLYNNDNQNQNIDFKKRYDYLRNLNEEKNRRKKEQEMVNKKRKQIEYQNYIKELKSKIKKGDIEDNSEWVRDSEESLEISDEEDNSEWVQDTEKSSEIVKGVEDITSNLSELTNNYPRFDKRYEKIYGNNNTTLLTNLY